MSWLKQTKGKSERKEGTREPRQFSFCFSLHIFFSLLSIYGLALSAPLVPSLAYWAIRHAEREALIGPAWVMILWRLKQERQQKHGDSQIRGLGRPPNRCLLWPIKKLPHGGTGLKP